MSNYNYVNRVLIGDGTNSGAITSIAGIQKGDLFLLRENGTVVATNAAAAAIPRFERVCIASGIGPGIAILSSPIQGNYVSKYEGQSYVAPSQLTVVIGYNGNATTGISISGDTEYRLRVILKDSVRPNGQRMTLWDANYISPSAGATPASAVSSIMKMFYQKDQGHNFIGDKVVLERTSNGVFTALTNNASVIQNSEVVASTAHGLSAGDAVRIGGTTYLAPTYIVASVIDANTFTLDIPYKGATATILAANIGELASPTEWGFKLTGLEQESFISTGNTSVDEYEWINFDAVFSEASSRSVESVATTTVVTNLNPGQGFWKQVRDREEAAKGYLGDTSKRRFHDKRIESQVVVGTSYDSIVITHEDSMRGDFQDTYNAPLKTEIYIPDGSDQGLNSANNFLHILNGYFSTSVGFTAITF